MSNDDTNIYISDKAPAYLREILSDLANRHGADDDVPDFAITHEAATARGHPMSYHIIDTEFPIQTVCNMGDAARLVAAINHDLLTERGSNGLFRLLNEISDAAEYLEANYKLQRRETHQ